MAYRGIGAEDWLYASTADSPSEIRVLACHEATPGVEAVPLIEPTHGLPIRAPDEEVCGGVASRISILCCLLGDEERFAQSPHRIEGPEHHSFAIREALGGVS